MWKLFKNYLDFIDGKLELLYSKIPFVGVLKSEKLVLLNPCERGLVSLWGNGGAVVQPVIGRVKFSLLTVDFSFS